MIVPSARVQKWTTTNHQQLFSRPKDPDDSHRQKSGTVYRISCIQCNFVYYGPTERSLKTRIADTSAGTGKLCILGHLGLVFIWSCFVSCLLFLLFYVSLRNLCSGTCRKIPNCGAQKGSGKFWPELQSCKPCPPFQPQHELWKRQGRWFRSQLPRATFLEAWHFTFLMTSLHYTFSIFKHRTSSIWS